ncbi:DUF6861 domain-containing protein [uncultured Thiodictyon sp.]|uniref:DUF6861 domain-containing protein n=1 Tax=uncultured Thiodictyon sp. TaxID=1846217 RepID=UPI0025F4EFC5|nr:hypothetical protein [uncultured Thiodictyon sp.]
MAARAAGVLDAYGGALKLAPTAVYQETGYQLELLIRGLLPGLLQMLAVLGVTTILGAAAGASVGVFFGGVGAAPGAVVGGELGLEAGTAVLSWLGLAFLAESIGRGLGELGGTLRTGIVRAWRAAEHEPFYRRRDVDQAAAELAKCVGILFRLILQGILAYVMKKGAVTATRGAAAAGRSVLDHGAQATAQGSVAEVTALLRKSKLSEEFAAWVEKNWDDLSRNPKLTGQTATKSGGGSKTSSAATPSQLASPTKKPAGEAAAAPASGKPSTAAPGARDKSILDAQGVPLGARKRSPDAPDTFIVDAQGVPFAAINRSPLLDAQGLPVNGCPKPSLKQALTKEGWPELPEDHAGNFNTAEPVTLKPGTKIYRIIDHKSNAAGRYWAESLPSSRTQWRSDYAVKQDWNSNGSYVEYTVPEGPGLKVWRGETAGQELKGSGGYYLPGGAEQIWMEEGTVIPSKPIPTGW